MYIIVQHPPPPLYAPLVPLFLVSKEKERERVAVVESFSISSLALWFPTRTTAAAFWNVALPLPTLPLPAHPLGIYCSPGPESNT